MYLAIDQRNDTQFWLKSEHPRKELLDALGYKHADKIYVDRSDGTYHIGYIVNRRWFTILGIEGSVFAKKVGKP